MIKDMHQSSLEMEAMTKSVKKVADKTATQTSSMHLITLATFLFLPATFVAVRLFGLPSFSLPELTVYLVSEQTFLSSGAFKWDQNNPDGSSMPFWKLGIFCPVCSYLLSHDCGHYSCLLVGSVLEEQRHEASARSWGRGATVKCVKNQVLQVNASLL